MYYLYEVLLHVDLLVEAGVDGGDVVPCVSLCLQESRDWYSSREVVCATAAEVIASTLA